MNKKLTAKIQKLVPILGEKENELSSSLAIEPEERELVLKKGSVYTVYQLVAPVELDTALINKVINDVLFDSYYQSDNISPIQSLEKAVLNINEKMANLAAEEQAVKGVQPISEQKVKFDIIAGVLWGNVLYIVQYGNGNSFLMREGNVNKVSSTSEGNFSVASGVVKDDDVIVLCTQVFSEKYPPDKLLSTSLSSNDLEHNQACLIMKFMVDSDFTEDEEIDFNLKKENKVPKVVSMLQGIKLKRGNKNQAQDEAIASLADMDSQEEQKGMSKSGIDEQAKKERPNIKLRASRDSRFKISSTHLIIIVVVLLLISLGATIVLRRGGEESEQAGENGQNNSSLTMPQEFNKNSNQPQAQQQTQSNDNAQNQPAKEETPAEPENLPNLVRLPVQPFYDLKLADENANPNNIVLFNQTVAATDSASGKIFTSDLETPKFTALENTFPGIAQAENYDGKLNFKDNEGYKSYDLVSKTISQRFDGSFGITARYLGNIYSIEGQTLKKYVPSGEELTSSTWAENPELEKATAMDIAYSIYITTSDNNLAVYTQGKKADFSVTGLETPLNRLTDLEVSTTFDHLYLADAGNNRVLVLDKKGALVKQIHAENDETWNDIRSISVSNDETTMFVLNGSKVYKINLSEALSQ